MRSLIFAGNWKMHLGPAGARDFVKVFLQRYEKKADAEVWFFPPAVSIDSVASQMTDRTELKVGAQDVHWESKGAFTGQTSLEMVSEAGGTAALVGHSERRHVFGETDEETGKKARAVLAAGLIPVFCVGEKLEEREAGQTLAVVKRQLSVLEGLDQTALGDVVVAYEPVWAIGTGAVATPADAVEVHEAIKLWFSEHGARDPKVLYGGSVKSSNVAELIAQPSIDGVLVGGASLDPSAWAELVNVRPD
jgi:triosephosphate isomerase